QETFRARQAEETRVLRHLGGNGRRHRRVEEGAGQACTARRLTLLLNRPLFFRTSRTLNSALHDRAESQAERSLSHRNDREPRRRSGQTRSPIHGTPAADRRWDGQSPDGWRESRRLGRLPLRRALRQPRSSKKENRGDESHHEALSATILRMALRGLGSFTGFELF